MSEKIKHKHYDVIVAWAAGETIQVKISGNWYDIIPACKPSFEEKCEYQIKPKPDVVEFIVIEGYVKNKTPSYNYYGCRQSGCPQQIKITRDGNTGELKSTEIIKGE